MSRAREWWFRLRSVIARDAMEREMDEEMRFHLAQDAERNVRRGMGEAEAERAALVRFGGVERFKEAAREEHRSRRLEDLVQDVRHSARALRRAPLFTAIAVLSLALGIGANTAIFSAVDAVLLKSLPYPDAEALVRVSVLDAGEERGSTLSNADVEALNDARSFESHGSYFRERAGITLAGAEAAETIAGTWVTPGVFATLGVAPHVGRAMTADDGIPERERVVLLSYEFWQARYAGAPDAIGRTLTLNGDTYTLIGVMPPGFRLPRQLYDDVWPVLQLDPAEERSPFWLTTLARQRPELSLSQVQAELSVLEQATKARFPTATSTWTYEVMPLKETLVRDTRATLFLLFGAVVLVLLIAAANVANLLLARVTTRTPELAVRTALGASRGRLVRLLLTESVLVASLGAALGVVLAYVGISAFSALMPVELPRFHEIAIDMRVLLFAIAVTIVTGIAVGLVPALRVPAAVAGGIREGGRSGAGMGERGRLRSLLVVAEFAFALTVLIGAGLLVNSLMRLQRVDPGAATEGILAAQVSVPQAQYDTEEKLAAFFDALLERMRATPGVQSVSVSMGAPPDQLVMTNPFTPEGRTYGVDERPAVAAQLMVSPDYFATLAIPLRSGRTFTDADREGAPNVAIINETMARLHFPNQDPIGRWLQLGDPRPDATRRTIIGVAADVSYVGLAQGDMPTVYLAYAQNAWWPTMFVLVRTTRDPLSLAAAVRREVAALDPYVPVRDVRTMQELMNDAVAEPRFRTMLLGSFALIALLLASAGIYGVMAYSVTQRRREMSVRLALGARPGDLVRLVIINGMRIVAAGVVLGLIGAGLLTRYVRSVLFQVDALDPLTFGAAAAFLAGIALLACYVPAARSARADPAAVLNTE